MLPVIALAVDELDGDWRGSTTLPNGDELSIDLHLEQTVPDEWSAEIQTSESGGPITPETLSVSGTAVSFRFQTLELDQTVIFSGNYSAWNDAIRGVLIYGGESLMMRLDRVGVAPGVQEVTTTPGDTVGFGDEVAFERIRHQTNFGLVGRVNLWKPIYIIKEDRRNINDITSDEGAIDVGLRWYAMDDLAIYARYVNGGLGFHTNSKNLERFGFSGLEYIDINGYEFGMNMYVGDILAPNSNFNPYITAYAGKMDWQLGVNGPDSEPFRILDEPVEGNDLSMGAGLGVEYLASDTYAIELEWIWRYVFTEDDTRWEDTENLWTNTHLWSLSLGLVRNF
jgi:hypothetical protein